MTAGLNFFQNVSGAVGCEFQSQVQGSPDLVSPNESENLSP